MSYNIYIRGLVDRAPPTARGTPAAAVAPAELKVAYVPYKYHHHFAVRILCGVNVVVIDHVGADFR